MVSICDTKLNIKIKDQIKFTYYHATCNGKKIIIDKNTGYINGMQLSKEYNKECRKWLRNASTKLVIKLISKTHKITNTFYVINGGRNTLIRGTYIHPLLFTTLLHWLETSKQIKRNNGYMYIVSSSAYSLVKVGIWTGTEQRLHRRYVSSFGKRMKIFIVELKGDLYKYEKEFAKKYKKYNDSCELYNAEHYDKYKKHLLSLVDNESDNESDSDSNDDSNSDDE